MTFLESVSSRICQGMRLSALTAAFGGRVSRLTKLDDNGQRLDLAVARRRARAGRRAAGTSVRRGCVAGLARGVLIALSNHLDGRYGKV